MAVVVAGIGSVVRMKAWLGVGVGMMVEGLLVLQQESAEGSLQGPFFRETPVRRAELDGFS